MALTVEWHESVLEVRARVVPRYLWTTASIDVLVDGEPVLCTGGQRRVFGSMCTTFRHNGQKHEAELAWGRFADGAFPFTLRIDGELLLASEVPLQNALAVQLGWLGCCGVMIAVVALGVILLSRF
jgi:hypothetical protein